uniref:Uncharacterized protein n=1 Tax=Arundo donax TaxID=35708 RepID=A0A0A9H3L0_ARUDO
MLLTLAQTHSMYLMSYMITILHLAYYRRSHSIRYRNGTGYYLIDKA